jgi:hypothetical protein
VDAKLYGSIKLKIVGEKAHMYKKLNVIRVEK